MKLSDYGVNSNSLGDSSVHLGSGEYLEQLYNLDNQQCTEYLLMNRRSSPNTPTGQRSEKSGNHKNAS